MRTRIAMYNYVSITGMRNIDTYESQVELVQEGGLALKKIHTHWSIDRSHFECIYDDGDGV